MALKLTGIVSLSLCKFATPFLFLTVTGDLTVETGADSDILWADEGLMANLTLDVSGGNGPGADHSWPAFRRSILASQT